MIDSLKPDQNTTSFFLCKEKQSLLTKTGSSYLKILLSDKTGTLKGMIWHPDDENIAPFESNDVVKVQGQISLFQNEKQINIFKIRKACDGEYEPTDFYRATEKDVQKLYNYIQTGILDLVNPYLKKLMTAFFPENGPQKDIFIKHPAAKAFHHNYQGGLLEHSVSVAQIAMSLVNQYPEVDSELVFCGALLHDIGKTVELTPAPTTDYTLQGRFIGHIVTGAMMVSDKIKVLYPDGNFPEDLKLHLIHMILSHHGALEYGSPVVPATAEAFILHLADDADAKLKETDDAIRFDTNDGDFTSYNKPLERYLYKGQK